MLNKNPYAAYTQSALETEVMVASPHKLILMLFDGAIKACNLAKLHMRNGAIADKGKRVRFPLNIAQGRNTGTARSVGTYSGAGVHHIALETGDIFAAARALAASGAPVLAIPQNYYEDLGARYGLDEARLAELASLNLLYERDAQGEFLHLYTLPFEDRFFFEFVQRIDGYNQYGASNAPVRMAALAEARRSSTYGL